MQQQHEASLAGVRQSAARMLRQRPEFKRTHDIKKMALIAGLAALSWISTYSGMLELVMANLGDLDLMFKIAIGASVAMLMLMVVWLLDQLFNEVTAFPVRVLYIVGYLFLTLISVGFSFGFYWKFLESRSEASRGAESAVTQVQGALHGAQTRLDQMGNVFAQLALVSTKKAEDENAKGNSCPNSKPGDGPRRRLRDQDAASFSTASQFVQQRSAALKQDVAALEGDLQKIVHQDKSTFDLKTGTRNDFIKGLGRKLELTVVGFNAFRSDPQLKQLRADFAERADKTVFPDEQGKTFACPDPQIQAALRSAVKAIDALPVLEKPEITTVEGADATIEAFRRLNTTLLGLAQFKLAATPDQIRDQQVRAIATGGVAAKAVPVGESGLSQRDYIPLAIALFVDLCLLLVSIPKPLSSSERTRRRRQQSDGETYRTLDDMYAIHDDPDARAKMEPLRHIAFDYMGHDYVAIPLIAGREGQGGDHDGSARNLTDDDLLEAQFIQNFFSSQETGGPFRRASFPPVAAVRTRLKQLGSKWAGIKSFRLYRFKKGAWSDFVMDMVVGADHELTPVREKQLEARIKKNEMKSSQIVFQSELMEIEHDAVKSAKRKEAELNSLMIETNITGKQQEADLRRREISAQSELSTLGLEASITAKRAEIERTKREIARTYETDLDSGRANERIELRADGNAPRKAGFWDKLMGSRDEAHGPANAEPTLERKASHPERRAAAEVKLAAEAVASSVPAGKPQTAAQTTDVAALRETVSELALVVRELANQQSAQVAAATRAAVSPRAPESNGQATYANGSNGSNGHAYTNGHAQSYADASGFDANSHVAGTAHLPGDTGSVILMPNLSNSRGWAETTDTYADRTPWQQPNGETGSASTQGHYSNGNTALAYDQNYDQAPAPTPRRAPFRWAAESTMAGGVHQIDHAIEPTVRDAISVHGQSTVAPELQQSWETYQPTPELADAVSSAAEINAFLTGTRSDAEEAAEAVVEDQDADWRQVVAQRREEETDEFEAPLGHDRETLEIERIATRFGRGGNRRKVRN
jgi:hypothetical protein